MENGYHGKGEALRPVPSGTRLFKVWTALPPLAAHFRTFARLFCALYSIPIFEQPEIIEFLRMQDVGR